MTSVNNTDEIKFAFREAEDGSYRVVEMTKSAIRPELPPAVYRLALHDTPEATYFYLKPVFDFKLPKRIYGSVNKNVDRFLRSYCMNDNNLGVLLVGERGSGKTITLKELSRKAIESGMPVILVDQLFGGALFISFMASITQQCVVCFDEFCKVYSEMNENGGNFISKAQDSILQLLDGTVSSAKKLFVFTVNNIDLVSDYMKDRQGRVRYVIPFKQLSQDVIDDYLKVNLNVLNEDHMNAFFHMAKSYGENEKAGLNFDNMSNYVKEMNQFNCDLNECLELMAMNGRKSYAFMEVKLYRDGQLFRTGAAIGSFKGAYVAKDDFEITMRYMAEDVNEDGNADMIQTTIANKNFVGYFGNDYNTIEMKRDDTTYVCRYITREEHSSLEISVRADINKAHVENRKAKRENSLKIENNGISGAVIPATHADIALGYRQTMMQAYNTNSNIP